MEEFSSQELLSLEKDLLGFYLTKHPLAGVLSFLSQQRSHQLYQLSHGELPRQKVRVGGMVNKVRVILTRKSAR